MTRSALCLLAAAVLIALAIVVLIALHDAIPAELWAIDFSLVTAAGVAIQHNPADTTTGPRV